MILISKENNFALAQLALIFMPSIIWANIDTKYGSGLKPSQTTLAIRAFLFGMATYSALFLIYTIFGREFGYASLGDDSEAVKLVQLRDEIAWSIPLSFILSILWLFSIRFRLLMKFLHRIQASRRYGDEDVWSYTLNSDLPNVEYVHFRDLQNGFIFTGWINTYSEGQEDREILLRDAIVYNEEGDEISQSPFLYISRPKNDIWIEFPYRQEEYEND